MQAVPPCARQLTLRKKEAILGALLAMGDDHDDLSRDDFRRGIGALGLPIGADAADALFAALDRDHDGTITVRTHAAASTRHAWSRL